MRFKLLQVDTLFPVPLCSFALPDAAAINGALEAEIAIRRANEPSLTVSNRGGWHSARDLFVRTEPAQRALCEALRGAIDEATRQLVPDAAPAIITARTTIPARSGQASIMSARRPAAAKSSFSRGAPAIPTPNCCRHR